MTVNLARVGGRTQFFMSFRLADGDGSSGLQLRYDLVKPLMVVLHDPSLSQDTRLHALYTEVDISANGTLTHSILMTAAVELRVRFTNLLVAPLAQTAAPGLRRSDIRELIEMVSLDRGMLPSSSAQRHKPRSRRAAV